MRRTGKIVLMVLAALAASTASFAWADPMEDKALAQVKGQAPGTTKYGEVLRGATEKTDFQVALESRKCYWFSAVSEGKVEKIATYLWAPGAGVFTPRLISERSETGNVVLSWCAKVSGMYRFQTKIEGKGEYLIAVYAKDAPPEEAPPVVVEAATVDLGAICDKKAKGAAPGATRVGDFFEGAGNSIGHDDRFDFPIQLDAGKCYWIIACGEPDHIKSISLYLWGPNDKRITEAKSDNPSPMIGHCAKETGMFKFQAKITGGGGKMKAGLYAK